MFNRLSGLPDKEDDSRFTFTGEDARWYQIFQVCREMHWSYAEYLQNPAHFNRRVEAFLLTENRARQGKEDG